MHTDDDVSGHRSLSAWRLRELLSKGELTSEDLVRACVDRIEDLDPTMRAFITVVADQAVEQARRADLAAARGEELGPLWGIPIAVKDDVWTGGIVSSGGSLLFRDFVPTEDGEVARRLRDAGAIIIGKTNMPEFGHFPRSISRIGGETVNPWDTSRTPGASSGGSAAALASGMVPIAVGSDGGGSIRIPASLCGVAGLHPTPGRVPNRGSFSYSPNASVGPMACDVRDLATLYMAIAGYDPADATSERRPTPDALHSLDDGVTGLRIGFSPDFGYVPVDDDVADVVQAAVERLEQAGATIEELELDLARVPETRYLLSRGSGLYGQGPVPFTRTKEFEELCRDGIDQLCDYTQRALLATPPAREDYEHACDYRRELLAQFEQIFLRYDAIVSPTMHVTAPLIPEGWTSPYDDAWMGTPFTGVVNVLGCTAASYPAGLVHGLPVGIQAIGKAWDEGTVLRVCRGLELSGPSPT